MINRLAGAVVTVAHGRPGRTGSTSVVQGLAPLKVSVILTLVVVGFILCLRGMGTWGRSRTAGDTNTDSREPLGWNHWFLVGSVLLVAPLLSFDRFAFEERIVTVPESPVPFDVVEDGPAEVEFVSATDTGDVHLDAENPTKLALNLDCEIRALDESGFSAARDDPALRAPVLLLPGDSKVLEMQLPVERRVSSMTASCVVAPFSRKQRARLDSEGIPYW